MARRKAAVQMDEDDETMDGAHLRAIPQPEAVNGGIPRVRNVRTIIDEEQEVGSAEIDDEPEENPVDVLLAELGGGTDLDISVSKLDRTKPNGRIFCGSIPAGGMNNSQELCTRIQNEFGGGDFYLQIRDPAKNRLSKRILVSVAPPKTPAALPAQQVGESVSAAIKAALEPLQAVMLAQAQQKPALDLGKLASHPLAATIISALVGKLLGGGGSDKFDLDTYLSMKAKMDAAGFGDGEPNTLAQVGGLLKEYGKPLIELAAKQAAQQTGPGAMRPAPSAVVPMAAPGVMPAPPAGVAPGTVRPVIPAGRASSTTLNVGQMLAPFIPAIVGLAQSGADAHTAAEQIANVLPDEYVDPVCDAIESGELVTILTRTPQLSGYSVWLAQVGDALLSMMETEDEPAPANSATPDEHAGGDDGE